MTLGRLPWRLYSVMTSLRHIHYEGAETVFKQEESRRAYRAKRDQATSIEKGPAGELVFMTGTGRKAAGMADQRNASSGLRCSVCGSPAVSPFLRAVERCAARPLEQLGPQAVQIHLFARAFVNDPESVTCQDGFAFLRGTPAGASCR